MLELIVISNIPFAEWASIVLSYPSQDACVMESMSTKERCYFIRRLVIAVKTYRTVFMWTAWVVVEMEGFVKIPLNIRIFRNIKYGLNSLNNLTI